MQNINYSFQGVNCKKSYTSKSNHIKPAGDKSPKKINSLIKRKLKYK